MAIQSPPPRLTKYLLLELRDEFVKKPDKFTHRDARKRDIIRLLRESDTGYTPQEILSLLNLENIDDIARVLKIYFKKGLIVKCPFNVPVKIKGVSRTRTPIYGKNMEAVYRAVENYMSDPVKHAFQLIRNDLKVWPIWILKEQTGITDTELNSWFKNAFYKANLINFKVVGFRSYYYHPQIPEDRIKKEIADFLKEKIELDEWQERLLADLRHWIYKKGMQAKGWLK